MSLIAAYNFEAEDAQDITGNGYDLTVNTMNGSPLVAGYESTYAVQAKNETQGEFGSAAYGAFPGGAPGSSPRTMMFWAQRVGATEAALLSVYNSDGRGDPFAVYAEFDGTVQAWWYDSSDVGSGAPLSIQTGVMPSNVWTHVAVVLQPGVGVTIYVNGSVATTYAWQDGTSATFDRWDTLLIGSHRWGSQQAIIDDVRIYDEALSAGQIATLKDTPLEGEQPFINSLHVGNGAIEKLYLGNIEVAKAYLGTTLVYGQGDDGEDTIDQGSLYLTPAEGTFTTGNTVEVEIRVNSGEYDINVVQANLSYPTGMLAFQSISHVGSPFTTPVQAVGGGGSVELGVGVLSGSVSGDQLVATVTFIATGAGVATIDFDEGSGIATYPDATDILNTTRGASYDIS